MTTVLRYIDHDMMGRGQMGWLDSHYHFSFADYWNEENVHFGVLRVLNDDLVGPGTGFDTHAHDNMEVLSYVVDGELTHTDSMGNRRKLTRGQVQYMSAGTGVQHGEYNYGHEVLRFLQIWILPDAEGHTPQYGDAPLPWDERIGRWMPIASGDGDAAFPIQVHADVHLYAALVPRGDTIEFAVRQGRQAYLVQVEGRAEIEGIEMYERDALEITEQNVHIRAEDTIHLLVVEMAKAP